MFGMFGSAKIKAECLGNTLDQLKYYSGLNLNKITNKENFELQEGAFDLLQDAVGKQKKYLPLETICATWLALLNSANENSNHSFSGKKSEIEDGLRVFLSVHINDIARKDMAPGLLSLLNKYL